MSLLHFVSSRSKIINHIAHSLHIAIDGSGTMAVIIVYKGSHVAPEQDAVTMIIWVVGLSLWLPGRRRSASRPQRTGRVSQIFARVSLDSHSLLIFILHYFFLNPPNIQISQSRVFVILGARPHLNWHVRKLKPSGVVTVHKSVVTFVF